MITLEKFRWGNWFSYGDNNEIDFTKDILSQIIGLNGHGKSSIPLILEETIYNKNSKGIKKSNIPNRYIKGTPWSELYFTKDVDSYVLRQERKSTVKVTISKNGEDISSHTATNTLKTVEEIFGKDFKTFSQLIYQNVKNSLDFLTATDSTRKKFLMELWQLDVYDENFEKFKSAAKKVSTEADKLKSKLDTIQSWIDSNNSTSTELLPLETEPDIDTKPLNMEALKIESDIKACNDTIAKIRKNEAAKSKLAAAIEPERPDLERRSYDEDQQKLGTMEAVAKAAQLQINKLSKLGDNCPTCEQPIDSEFKNELISKEKLSLDSATEEINYLIERINTIKADNDKLARYEVALKNYETLKNSVDFSIADVAPSIDSMQDRLDEIHKTIETMEAEVLTIRRRNSEKIKHNSKVEVYLEQAEKMEADLKVFALELEGLYKNLTNLEILKKAFSSTGLPAYKLENLIKGLEKETNYYLAEIADGRFSLEFVLVSDKLNVVIHDNEHTVEINDLSSGELARVNTATLLAIRKLMNKMSSNKINVLFLDEVINVLDEYGREKLVEILLNEQDLNTFIVSHGWTHPLLAKIEVVKENNISRLLQ